MNKVVSFDCEIGMAREPHAEKEVPFFPATRAGFSLPRQPNALSFVHAAWDLDLIGFHFLGIAAPQGDLPGGTIERFLQRDHDVGLDILSALGARRSSTESAAEGRLAASAAEKRLEEIAEPGAAEFELNAAAVPPGVTAESPARSAPSPIRRRLKSARLIPVRAELIVLGAFLGIAQDLVSLVDLFEFLLSRDFFFGLGHVGMMFARELTKSAFDFIGTCRLRNTERLVVIPELNRHKSCG